MVAKAVYEELVGMQESERRIHGGKGHTRPVEDHFPGGYKEVEPLVEQAATSPPDAGSPYTVTLRRIGKELQTVVRTWTLWAASPADVLARVPELALHRRRSGADPPWRNAQRTGRSSNPAAPIETPRANRRRRDIGLHEASGGRID